MTIKSLNTKYAGCLFRSRLEARWAVYFDHMGVAWEYEPQGFELADRLQLGVPEPIRYLPDFWFPELEAYGEVKGSLNDVEVRRLLSAAACLSSNDGGGCHDSGGHDLIVFGPLTTGRLVGAPIRLHMHKGDLEASRWGCGAHTGTYVAHDHGQVSHANIATLLLAGYGCARHDLHDDHLAALDAARTARFEHGAKPRKAKSELVAVDAPDAAPLAPQGGVRP